MLIALALALVTILFSAVYSGSETGIYRLSRLRLRLGTVRGRPPFALLSRAMRDSTGLLLSLLVANNLANYLATSSITYLFLAVASEGRAELLATLLTAPLLFVFGESLPKNIFLHRADTLTGYLGPLLFVTYRALMWSGIVPLLRVVSNLFARLTGSPTSSRTAITSSQSHQVKALLRDTQEEGLLSTVQTEMIDRIVTIPGLRLSDVMVPLDRARSIRIQSDRTALLDELKRHALTRLLVWRDTPRDIAGFINLYEVLGTDDQFESLEKFLKPIRSLGADTSVIDTIDFMRRAQSKIVLVTRRRGKRDVPVGIVTMKDLVEELMGELAEW